MRRAAIEDYLINLKVPTGIKGFNYLVEAIKAYHIDIKFTKELYPQIATKLNTTPSRVERAIRHAISKSVKPLITSREFISHAKIVVSRQASE